VFLKARLLKFGTVDLDENSGKSNRHRGLYYIFITTEQNKNLKLYGRRINSSKICKTITNQSYVKTEVKERKIVWNFGYI